MSLNFTPSNNTEQEQSISSEILDPNTPEINLSNPSITNSQKKKNHEKKNLEIKMSEDKTVCTYKFSDEDHTLGNFLRFLLMKDPRVNFSGYSIIHPSENSMNLRVQSMRLVLMNVLLVLWKGWSLWRKRC